MPPPHTCCLNPQLWAWEDFSPPPSHSPALSVDRRRDTSLSISQGRSRAQRLSDWPWLIKGLGLVPRANEAPGRVPGGGDAGSIPAIPWKTQACGSSARSCVSLPNSSSSLLPFLGGGRRCWRTWWGHSIYCHTYRYLTAAKKAARKPKQEKINIPMN